MVGWRCGRSCAARCQPQSGKERQNDARAQERGRLGPIPILGDIFGPRTKSENRNELIFFLRPTVLTNIPAVDNVEEFMKKVTDAGGQIALAKFAIPGIGWQAYCIDTEGNPDSRRRQGKPTDP